MIFQAAKVVKNVKSVAFIRILQAAHGYEGIFFFWIEGKKRICQAAQKVQTGTTAMMTQQHHVFFLYDFILCPLRFTSHLPLNICWWL